MSAARSVSSSEISCHLLVLGQLLEGVGQLAVVQRGRRPRPRRSATCRAARGRCRPASCPPSGRAAARCPGRCPARASRSSHQSTIVTWPRRPKRLRGAGFAQRDLGQLPVVRPHRPHRRRRRSPRGAGWSIRSTVRSNRSSITSVSECAALEPTGVDHAGDDDLDGVDAAHPGHRDEDPVPGEQLDHQPLDPRRAHPGPTLDDDVPDPPDLVARDRPGPAARGCAR